MTKKVFSIDTQPGIQRDGTVTDRIYYEDGRWCRFQRGRPRKMLGFREITATLAGPSRGIFLDPNDGFNNIFSGYNNGVQVVAINNLGIGSGIQDFTLSGFTPNNNNLWQFDSLFETSGTNQQFLLAHPGQNLSEIDSTVNTPVLGGDINGTSLTPIGVFTATGSTNATTTITLSAINPLVAAGQIVTDSGGDITLTDLEQNVVQNVKYMVTIGDGDTFTLPDGTTVTSCVRLNFKYVKAWN